MSVFRFEATPASSRPISRRIRGKNRDTRGPGFAFSTSPSLLQDITLEKTDVGIRTTASSGLTMKEYEEQLKKLTAENFNLKLKVYFVEERLSKVTGISDKEDLIKKNIQLKVTCESQLKELEKKQELLFEASKAFELLQKEHGEEIEKLNREKDREILDLEEKLASIEATYNELKAKFPNIENLNALNFDLKTLEEYDKQINDLEQTLREEEDKNKELENLLKDNQLEVESFRLKSQRVEKELEQRERRIEELVDELELKERDLASANFRIRKLEDELKSRQREDEIMKERLEEKNKTIESLKSSLSTKDESIEALENRVAKERSSVQSLQSKIDSLFFQNSRLKEELEILQSRLRRTTESLSPRGKPRSADDEYKQKYEDAVRAMDDAEAKFAKRVKELEEKLYEKQAETEDYKELFEKHKKLEDDHRKACTALKNFIKRSSEDKKEREALNHMLNSHEEVIADLKAQLDHYRSSSLAMIAQDEKLSLAGTGDNERKAAAADDRSGDVEEETKVMEREKLREPESRPMECTCGVEEKLQKIVGLEAEISVLKKELDECKGDGQSSLERQLLLNDLETKKCEIEKLNGELQKRNMSLQEIVNKELREKNCQIEKLEKQLAEVNETNTSLPKISSAVETEEKGQAEEQCENKTLEFLQVECAKAKEQADKADAVKKEVAEVCTLLSARLEELAEFLDSLLTNNSLLSGIGLQKRQDIKQAMEKSRELSKHLSQSFARKNLSDTSLVWNMTPDSFMQNDSFSILLSRDKVISEQTIIINKLREQLKVLNQEIKQRDIELFHCQCDQGLPFEEDRHVSSDQGIEGQSLSICQEISDDDDDDDDDDNEVEERKEKTERTSAKLVSEKRSAPAHDTSESETWSEPDRSVSLARMGRLEDVTLNISNRNSKCDDSSDSSEETLNENSRNSGKRCRSHESEIRRLQTKIKTLDEVNEGLCQEIAALKNEKVDSSFVSRFQKNEEANLLEKLRKTMDRLDECSLTCRQLEEKLARALERASVSAMQLSKAQETISVLEEEICRLKDDITSRKLEAEEKARRIAELEKKVEEMAAESEQKIAEAVRQREAAEQKTLEVECRLKDAENMSREVESRVSEIEKKISETKKFKKETVQHFREAERHVDTAEKMMEEAERMKTEAERKSKDFQSFIDLMRKEVEEKLKEAERRVKKSEREKEELEKQAARLKKRLVDAERHKAEVEARVREGKETIQCMEEKLRELEVALEECGEEAQRKVREIQKKADVRVAELEVRLEERERARRAEVERKMTEAERLSRELEVGFRKQLEEAEKKIKKTKENTDAAIRAIREGAQKQEAELRQKIIEIQEEKNKECSELRKQLDEAKLEASEFELELTKLTNEKIHLEEELTRMLNKESALVKDNKEIKGKYESSIHELENKLTQLTLNKSQLASRLEEIESTNSDLVSRISAIRGKETMVVEHEFTALSPPYSPPFSPHTAPHSPLLSHLFPLLAHAPATLSDPGDLPDLAPDPFAAPRRNMNSSPDLGIESDPGRFSSLEAQHQVHGDQLAIIGNVELSEVKKLEYENIELKRRLMRTRQALEETLTQLSAANQRKKQVERAICKQLHKTHHILKKARVNFESQDADAVE